MKHFFPPQNENYKFLQTNRSDMLGSIWSSFNLDFQSNLGAIRLAQKLVQNASSADFADLGVPGAFEFWDTKWYALCDTGIFTNSAYDPAVSFVRDLGGFLIGDSTTQFDVTNPSGTTFRYTFDGTGTDPSITALTFPIGSVVTITGTNLAAGNRGTFTITGSGANYFEVTNASGTAETDKTITTGSIRIAGGSTAHNYSFLNSDLATFNDLLWTTSDTELFSRSVNVYTSRDALTSGVLHKLCYFKKFNRLYYSNTDDTISSIDTNFVTSDAGSDYGIQLAKNIGSISTMVPNSSYIWIGTIKSTNSSMDNSIFGSISAWDGVSGQVSYEYVLTTAGVWAMCVLNDIPYAIDTEGRILKYTGYSFEEIARLPIDKTLLYPSTFSSNGETNGRPVHFNGMTGTKNNTILINVRNRNNDSTTDHTENLQSGIWELDLSSGNLTHRYSFSLKTLASSTVTDFGQNVIYTPGAIKLNTFGVPFAATNGRSALLAGAKIYTDATNSKSAIFIDSPAKDPTDTEGQKRGYFVTTFFDSNVISSTWLRLWTIYKRFANATDKMIFKYRLIDIDSIEAIITWTSTTTFTTTTNISAYAGFEAEIIQGTGSGACTNILTVTENAGTYTATIDTAVTGVTGTAKARFQKWIKLGEISNTVLSYGELPIDVADTTIQIKGILEFTGNAEFIKNILVSKEDVLIDS